MDELVDKVTCYNRRPLLLHGYLAPFFVLQAAVYYYFSTNVLQKESDDRQLEIDSSNKLNNVAIDQNSSLNSDGTTPTTDDQVVDKHSLEIAVIAVTIAVVAQVITYLFCHWSVDVKCWLSYSRCNDPFRSRFAKVTPTPNNGSTELVPLRREAIGERNILWFMFQKTKYIFEEKAQRFVAVELPCDKKLSYYRDWRGYADQKDVSSIDRHYGRNELEMVIPEFKELFFERATAPFFVFQVFSVGLWCLDEFWHYAALSLFMLVTFEILLVKQQIRNMQMIRQMGNQPFMIQVFRHHKWQTIRSDKLIPGDLVSVTRSEHSIPCDILLLRGSCIIDESTLTGESIPQMKESIEEIDNAEERQLDINQDKLHIIFGGTKVLQHTAPSKEPGCVGYVLRTGFHTSQGKLLRTILFGVKRVTANNFETFCFIMFLLFFAILSAYYVWTNGVEDPKRSRYRLFFECTVIITSVVPPELPIELSLAVNTSLLALSKLYIYCTEPFRIPFAGKVEYCCFDKTGTLTSDDLIVEGVAGLPRAEPNENQASEEEDIDDFVESVKKASPSNKANRSPATDTSSTKSALANHSMVTPISRCPISTQQVLASCHSLAHLDDKLVGDPLEKKVLEAINWNFSKSGTVSPKKGRASPLKIHNRFHFNSTLKRMSVVASYKMDMSSENVYICTSKGAPEYMRPLMKDVPEDYDKVYLEMSRLGARVLALGYKTLGRLSHQELSELKREDVEKDLMFSGFVLISCPLKPDSKIVSMELMNSGHRLVMITGDGALTACHVASVLNFISKDVLILTKVELNRANEKKGVRFEHEFNWISTDQTVKIPFDEACGGGDIKSFFNKYDLCLTGDAISYILKEKKEKFIYDIMCRVKVFARVSPKQKELIINILKSKGKTVLMCGDGTNDVGALKHAHVGVALISSSAPGQPRPMGGATQSMNNSMVATTRQSDENSIPNHLRRQLQDGTRKGASKGASNVLAMKNAATNNQMGPASPGNHHATAAVPMSREERRRRELMETQAKLKELLEAADEPPQLVKLGDASIAAPFSSRLSSTRCISHIIKQGRCTLVTTLQMFKILALNALLTAYCHSVLYLDGIKFSDAQATLQGLLSTFCFLFITRSQPLDKLSPQRPLPNIFNLYTILTVTLQFVVHFTSLVFLYSQAKLFQATLDGSPPVTDSISSSSPTDQALDAISGLNNDTAATTGADGPVSSLHTEFKASLINSTVFIIGMSVQLATFVVNYKGHPFMQNLRSNRPLCYSFLGTAFVVFALVNGWWPGLTEQLSVVEFPLEYRPIVLGVIVGDFVLAYLIDRVCEFLFGRLKLEPI